MRLVRFACVQTNPVLKDVAGNQRRAERLLQRRVRSDVDFILLPEMAFTGYCFESVHEIDPYCEKVEDGPTADWCRRVAARYRCRVAAGFPEKSPEGRRFNSMLVVDPTGRIEHHYRKHFLYTTDELWAEEGPGFRRTDLSGLGQCAFGICMDLNPRRFQAPFDRFEFASSLFEPPLRQGETPGHHRLAVRWIFLANNWLRNPVDDPLSEDDHARHLVNYWACRLSPALGLPAVALIANRVGIERTSRFAGCSCAIDLQSRTLLGRLGESEEDVLIVAAAADPDGVPATGG